MTLQAASLAALKQPADDGRARSLDAAGNSVLPRGQADDSAVTQGMQDLVERARRAGAGPRGGRTDNSGCGTPTRTLRRPRDPSAARRLPRRWAGACRDSRWHRTGKRSPARRTKGHTRRSALRRAGMSRRAISSVVPMLVVVGSHEWFM